MTRILIWVATIYIALGLLIVTVGAAYPHGWYEADCCSNEDCAPVALDPASLARIVDVGPAGIKIRIMPGDHSVVPNGYGERFFAWDDVDLRPSQDDNWHVCISKHPLVFDYGNAGDHRIYCVYMPPVGF